MVVWSGASSSQCFNGRAKRVSWSIVSRNRRHIHLDVEPKRTPIFGEISFAAWNDLNSCNSLPRILPTRVEGAARVVCFAVMPIVKFDDVRLDDQLEQSCEYIITKDASKGLHNPENFASSRNELGDN
jgi:hypothetical protein